MPFDKDKPVAPQIIDFIAKGNFKDFSVACDYVDALPKGIETAATIIENRDLTRYRIYGARRTPDENDTYEHKDNRSNLASYGHTPLTYAALLGDKHTHYLKDLIVKRNVKDNKRLAFGNSVGRHALLCVAHAVAAEKAKLTLFPTSYLATARILLEHFHQEKINVNRESRRYTEVTAESGKTALLIAAMAFDRPMTELLCEYGADPNSVIVRFIQDSKQPQEKKARELQEENVRVLIDSIVKKCGVENSEIKDAPAVASASPAQRTESSPASADKETKSAPEPKILRTQITVATLQAAAFAAIEKGWVTVLEMLVKLLLENGHALNFTNEEGSTLLDRIVSNDHDQSIKLRLIGAILRHVPEQQKFVAQQSALLLKAIGKLDYEVAKVLINHGADVTICDKNGRPLLLCVAMYSYFSETISSQANFARFLIETGKVDINATIDAKHDAHLNTAQINPLQYAAHNGLDQVVAAMLEAAKDIQPETLIAALCTAIIAAPAKGGALFKNFHYIVSLLVNRAAVMDIDLNQEDIYRSEKDHAPANIRRSPLGLAKHFSSHRPEILRILEGREALEEKGQTLKGRIEKRIKDKEAEYRKKSAPSDKETKGELKTSADVTIRKQLEEAIGKERISARLVYDSGKGWHKFHDRAEAVTKIIVDANNNGKIISSADLSFALCYVLLVEGNRPAAQTNSPDLTVLLPCFTQLCEVITGKDWKSKEVEGLEHYQSAFDVLITRGYLNSYPIFDAFKAFNKELREQILQAPLLQKLPAMQHQCFELAQDRDAAKEDPDAFDRAKKAFDKRFVDSHKVYLADALDLTLGFFSTIFNGISDPNTKAQRIVYVTEICTAATGKQPDSPQFADALQYCDLAIDDTTAWLNKTLGLKIKPNQFTNRFIKAFKQLIEQDNTVCEAKDEPEKKQAKLKKIRAEIELAAEYFRKRCPKHPFFQEWQAFAEELSEQQEMKVMNSAAAAPNPVAAPLAASASASHSATAAAVVSVAAAAESKVSAPVSPAPAAALAPTPSVTPVPSEQTAPLAASPLAAQVTAEPTAEKKLETEPETETKEPPTGWLTYRLIDALRKDGFDKDEFDAALAKIQTVKQNLASLKNDLKDLHPKYQDVTGQVDDRDKSNWIDGRLDHPNYSVLMHYAAAGMHDQVKKLLDAGFNDTVVNKNGECALSLAIANDHSSIVKLLVENCQKNGWKVIDSKGQTALMGAAKNGRWKIVRMLLEAGAEDIFANSEGKHALFYAVEAREYDIVRLLLAKKPSKPVSLSGGGSETYFNIRARHREPTHLRSDLPVLHIAAANLDWRMVQILIAGGADITQLADNGKNPVSALQQVFNIERIEIEYKLRNPDEIFKTVVALCESSVFAAKRTDLLEFKLDEIKAAERTVNQASASKETKQQPLATRKYEPLQLLPNAIFDAARCATIGLGGAKHTIIYLARLLKQYCGLNVNDLMVGELGRREGMSFLFAVANLWVGSSVAWNDEKLQQAKVDVIDALAKVAAEQGVALAAHGGTELLCAISNQRFLVAEKLVLMGADVNAVAPENKSVLYWAAHHGNLKFLKLLRATGKITNPDKATNRTPLHEAIGKGHSPEVCTVLIQLGCSINAKDRMGSTPLDLAVQQRRTDLIIALLDAANNSLNCPEPETLSAALSAIIKDYWFSLKDKKLLVKRLVRELPDFENYYQKFELKNLNQVENEDWIKEIFTDEIKRRNEKSKLLAEAFNRDPVNCVATAILNRERELEKEAKRLNELKKTEEQKRKQESVEGKDQSSAVDVKMIVVAGAPVSIVTRPKPVPAVERKAEPNPEVKKTSDSDIVNSIEEKAQIIDRKLFADCLNHVIRYELMQVSGPIEQKPGLSDEDKLRILAPNFVRLLDIIEQYRLFLVPLTDKPVIPLYMLAQIENPEIRTLALEVYFKKTRTRGEQLARLKHSKMLRGKVKEVLNPYFEHQRQNHLLSVIGYFDSPKYKETDAKERAQRDVHTLKILDALLCRKADTLDAIDWLEFGITETTAVAKKQGFIKNSQMLRRAADWAQENVFAKLLTGLLHTDINEIEDKAAECKTETKEPEASAAASKSAVSVAPTETKALSRDQITLRNLQRQLPLTEEVYLQELHRHNIAKLQSDGSFSAEEKIPRCPFEYDELTVRPPELEAIKLATEGSFDKLRKLLAPESAEAELKAPAVDVNQQETITKRTLLHACVFTLVMRGITQDISILPLVIKLGANVNAVDNRGYSALVLAIERGRNDLVAELLKGACDEETLKNALRKAFFCAPRDPSVSCFEDYIKIIRSIAQRLPASVLETIHKEFQARKTNRQMPFEAETGNAPIIFAILQDPACDISELLTEVKKKAAEKAKKEKEKLQDEKAAHQAPLDPLVAFAPLFKPVVAGGPGPGVSIPIPRELILAAVNSPPLSLSDGARALLARVAGSQSPAAQQAQPAPAVPPVRVAFDVDGFIGSPRSVI